MTGLLVLLAYAGVAVTKWPRYYLALARYERERFPNLDVETEDRVMLAAVATVMSLFWPLVVLARVARGPFIAMLKRIEEDR